MRGQIKNADSAGLRLFSYYICNPGDVWFVAGPVKQERYDNRRDTEFGTIQPPARGETCDVG